MVMMWSLVPMASTVTTRLFNSGNTSMLTREYKRTQGISTTDITDRILNLKNPDFSKIQIVKNNNENQAKKFNSTISKIVQFFDSREINKFTNGKVVYVTGAFDILRVLIRPGTHRVFKGSQKVRRQFNRWIIRGCSFLIS